MSVVEKQMRKYPHPLHFKKTYFSLSELTLLAQGLKADAQLCYLCVRATVDIDCLSPGCLLGVPSEEFISWYPGMSVMGRHCPDHSSGEPVLRSVAGQQFPVATLQPSATAFTLMLHSSLGYSQPVTEPSVLESGHFSPVLDFSPGQALPLTSHWFGPDFLKVLLQMGVLPLHSSFLPFPS